jgi:long-subunit fatty acid transport protein
MKTINIIISVTLVSLLFAQSPEEAVNFLYNQDGIGAKSQAMGNAFVGIADDYTAIYWNPAGLTQLYSSEICGDLYHLSFNNEATFKGNTVLDDRNFTKLKSLGLAYKFPTTQGNLVIAFGYNRTKDYDEYLNFSGYNTLSNNLIIPIINEDDEEIEYLFDRNVKQTEKINQDGNLSNWSLGGGIMLSPNFSIGLSLYFYSGSSNYLFDFYQDDINNFYNQYPADFTSYELHQKILSDFSGWGAKIGGLFQLNRSLKLGVAIDFPTTLNVLETYSENDALYYDDGYADEVDLGGGEWEYDVNYPFKFAAGIAFDLKQLTLAGTFEYRDWTQTKFNIPDGYSLNADYNDLLYENNYFADLFRATTNYHFGGEYRIRGSGLKIRGGYSFIPSPFSEAAGNLNRQYFSTGFGYDMDQNSTLNVSYTRGYWKKESIDDFTPGGTSESIQTSRILAGISYRF